MTFLDFMAREIGPVWVIARRTPKRIAKYGAGAVFISRHRYIAMRAKYDAAQKAGAAV
jgi:hypothetical protein